MGRYDTTMRLALTCAGVFLLVAAGCGRDTLVGETTYDAAVTTVYGADMAWHHGKYGGPLPAAYPRPYAGLIEPARSPVQGPIGAGLPVLPPERACIEPPAFSDEVRGFVAADHRLVP
jgi:hypothetical protein